MLDGKLYAMGGQDVDDDYATSNSVERYDLATNAWEDVAPMARVREDLGVAVLDGKLYAVGGYSDNEGGDILSSVERYDPALDAWEAVAPMATVGTDRARFGGARRQAIRCGRQEG